MKEWFQTYYGAANAVAGGRRRRRPRRCEGQGRAVLRRHPRRARRWPGRSTGSPSAPGASAASCRTGCRRPGSTRCGTCPAGARRTPSSSTSSAACSRTGKSSRLYKRLVYDEQIATGVDAYGDLREIGGLFVIEATARPGRRPRPRSSGRWTRSWRGSLPPAPRPPSCSGSRPGSAPGSCAAWSGSAGSAASPTCWPRARSSPAGRTSTRRGCSGSPAATRGADPHGGESLALGRRLHPRGAALRRVPGRGLGGGPLEAARRPARRPTPSSPSSSAPRSPTGSRSSSPRGTSIPQVRFNLLLDAGYAADQFGMPGTASLAMAMLDEGTRTRSSIGISDELAALGANLGAGSRLDMSGVTLEALKDKLDASLAVYADVILNPSFPRADFERLKRQRLAQIQQEKADPVGMALRVFPGLLYGDGHAYANPWTGSGTEASTSRITRDDLVKFHRTWFKPNNATLIVVGATTMAEIRPKLERAFAGWRPGDVPVKNIATVEQQPRPTVYLLDRPDATQSLILVGNVAPPKANPDEPAIETMNVVLGGVVHRPDQHESAGGQALVLRGVHLLPRRQGPAAVRRLRAGADRQDQGGDGRAAEGAARHPDRPAADGRGARPGQVGAHPHPARHLGDHGRDLRHPRRHRHLRPRRPLLRHLRRQGAGADRGLDGRGGEGGDPSRTSWSGSSSATGRRSRPASGSSSWERSGSSTRTGSRWARRERPLAAVAAGHGCRCCPARRERSAAPPASSAGRCKSACASAGTSGTTRGVSAGRSPLPVGRNLELRPSGDLFFPRDDGMGWQLNGDAAIRFGQGGGLYGGGGIAFVHPDGGGHRDRLQSVLRPEHRAAERSEPRPFIEFRWTFVNDTSPFRLALGFNSVSAVTQGEFP